MTVNALSNSDQSTAKSSRQTLAGNFDTFLKLLTTQLRQQDPLQPMDATTFTSQLVQYASVEQAIATNTKLESLTELMRTSSAGAALAMMGQDVTVTTDSLQLAADGGAVMSYRLPKAAETTKISILNEQGQPVWTASGGTAAGENIVSWDGLGSDGQRAAAGRYRVRIEAQDADGAKLAVEQFLRGRVDGVESRDGDFQLLVGGVSIPMTSVRDVRRPAQAPAGTSDEASS